MPSLSPRHVVAVLFWRIASLPAAARSRYAHEYPALTYPQIRIDRDVVLQPGARLRVHDGDSIVIGARDAKLPFRILTDAGLIARAVLASNAGLYAAAKKLGRR